MNTIHTIINNSIAAAIATTRAEVVASLPKRGNPESKAAKCREYYKNNPGLARKDYINTFVNVYGMTPDGAGTYVQNFRKAAKEGKL